jgi:hypothetical protein
MDAPDIAARARLLAVEVLLADPELLGNDALEGDLYILREQLLTSTAPTRRLQAIDDFLADYEAEHGEITEDEMRDATRRARERATAVRGRPKEHEAVPHDRGRPCRGHR